MSAPAGIAPGQDGSTSTRTKAETKRGAASRNRAISARLIRLMKSSGLEPQAWQIRQLLKSLHDVDEPSDDDLFRALMAAPWFPKRRRRQWRVGEAGWRTSS